MPSIPRTLPTPVRLFLILMLALTAACLSIEKYCQRVLHLPRLYTFPVFPEVRRFSDLELFRQRFDFFHSTAFFTQPGWQYMYPAPLSIVYKIFYLSAHSGRLFVAFAIVCIAFMSVLFTRALLARHLSFTASVSTALVLVFCSYALFFEIRQANLEFFVWVFISGGIWAFYKEHPRTAAVCFGVATAMKLFPFVFLGLFLARRQYRQAWLALAVAALTTLISLWALCPDLAVSWQGVANGLAAFRTSYVLHSPAYPFDHSLFALLRLGLSLNDFPPAAASSTATLASILSVYLGLSAGAGIILYFARIRKLPLANQVLCLTVASILFPPVSFDYTLIHLYAPLVLLLLAAFDLSPELGRPSMPGLTAVLCLCALLLAPETEFILHGVTYEGQFKACCLVALFCVGLCFRMGSDTWPNALQSNAESGR